MSLRTTYWMFTEGMITEREVYTQLKEIKRRIIINSNQDTIKVIGYGLLTEIGSLFSEISQEHCFDSLKALLEIAYDLEMYVTRPDIIFSVQLPPLIAYNSMKWFLDTAQINSFVKTEFESSLYGILINILIASYNELAYLHANHVPLRIALPNTKRKLMSCLFILKKIKERGYNIPSSESSKEQIMYIQRQLMYIQQQEQELDFIYNLNLGFCRTVTYILKGDLFNYKYKNKKGFCREVLLTAEEI